jgi:hypothetical protein
MKEVDTFILTWLSSLTGTQFMKQKKKNITAIAIGI